MSDVQPPKWPTGSRREFGRDGITGMVSRDRSIRAREVSKPRPEDRQAALDALPAMLRRSRGRSRRDDYPTRGQAGGDQAQRSS